MGKAEDLLNSVDNEPSLYLARPDLEPHIVIDETRKVTVPDELKRIAVQFDHNIETVTFDCPRYWDGHDMSKMVVYVNYACPDGTTLGSYPADNVRVDEEDSNIMHFEWTISRNVTQFKGFLTFLVCVKKTGEDPETGDPIEINHWNSELNDDMYISEGLECTETFETTYPDLYTRLVELSSQLTDDAAYIRENMEYVLSHAQNAADSAMVAVETYEMMEQLIGEGITLGPDGLFSLVVDPETGDLYAYYLDDSDIPTFEYDEETGDLYYVVEATEATPITSSTFNSEEAAAMNVFCSSAFIYNSFLRPAYKAFDGTYDSFWSCAMTNDMTGEYIGYNFLRQVTPSSVTISYKDNSGSSFYIQGCKDVELTDSSVWVNLSDEISGVTSSGIHKETYDISTTESYSMYRIYFTGGVQSTSKGVNVYEISISGKTEV